MSHRAETWIRRISPRRLVTPCSFLWIAAALVAVYLVCDGLGWREYTSVLSGTAEPGNSSDLCWLLGVIYVVAYLGVTVVAPILVLATGIFLVLLRVSRQGPIVDGPACRETCNNP